MPLIGTLCTMPLPDLLQWLANGAKSGTLQVERNKVRKWIQMSRGRVVGCSSDDPPHRLGQYLISRGKITAEQLREALALQEKTRQHLGSILVEMSLLSQEDLGAHLEAKAEDTIYSLFDWEDAVFRFDEGLDRRENSFPVDLQVQDILLRGLKHYDEMQRIRQIFHDPGIVLHYTAKPPPPEVFGNRMARTLYATIDGDRSIAEILLHVHGSEYVVYKFLYELHRNGYIEMSHVKRHDSPPRRVEPPKAAGLAVPASLTLEDSPRSSPGSSPGHGASPLTLEAELELDPLFARVATAAAPAPAADAGSLEEQLGTIRQMMAEAQYDGALDILDGLYRQHPEDESLRRLTAEAEAAFIDRAYRHYLPPDKIPLLTIPVESLESAKLSPPDFFLLSRIDGNWDIKSIIQIAPLREVEALRTLKRMRENGMIRLTDPG